MLSIILDSQGAIIINSVNNYCVNTKENNAKRKKLVRTDTLIYGLCLQTKAKYRISSNKCHGVDFIPLSLGVRPLFKGSNY